jgi:tripartite-type tricarboxylate transporter receptor subunit TctC
MRTVRNARAVYVFRAGASVALAVAVAAGWVPQAGAQSRYPTKPLRMVVPLPPAGSTDIAARLIAQRLGELLGQPVIVDNRPGAATTLGSALVARATPDGYALLFASVSLATTVPLYRNLPYDPVKDFAPVSPIGQSFYVLAVHPTVPVQTVQEFIALAKVKPKNVSYASAGPGTITHLTVELFIAHTKVDMLHVPYKGGAPALVALVSGQVQAIFNPIAEILPQIRAGGKVRTLAVTNPTRAPELPDVPTLAESGCPGCTVTPKSAVYAPAGTPQAVIAKLNAEINRAIKEPEFQERFRATGLTPIGGTSAELGDYLKSEIARWTKVVKDAGIKAE